jgi:hypothetical protein
VSDVLLSHYPHVSLHRLWAFTKLQVDLAESEFTHLIDCYICRTALLVCLKAENFAAALVELKNDSPLSEAS